jgi:hypothetical protein
MSKKPFIFFIPLKSIKKKEVMTKDKWWNIVTDKLSEKLNIPYTEMLYLGYLELETDRLEGLSPSESLESLVNYFGFKELKHVIKNGYMECDKIKNIEKYHEENPYFTTKAYLEKHKII